MGEMEGIEIHKALEEASFLPGARLSKVHEVAGVFFLRFFRPSRTLALDPLGKGIHLTALRPPAPPTPPPFSQLLRTLEGQPLLSLEQAGLDRVVRLRFSQAALILDLRPRRGNLFLLGDGQRRALHPGDFQEVSFGPGDPLAGVGPELRRALGSRLGRTPTEAELRDFATELLSLPPRGFLYQTDRGLRASFFPRPEWCEALLEFPSFGEALDRTLEERVFQGLAQARIAALRRDLARRERALAALKEAEEEAQRWPEIQAKADLILTRLSDIPRGAREVEVEGLDGALVRIALDPGLPPAAYAQTLYREVKKLRRRLEEIPARRAAIAAEIQRMEGELELLRTRPDLASYFPGGELPAAKAKPKSRPRQLLIEGFPVIVGRSAQENEEILRRASPSDLWLHARGVPGAHVLIKTGGRPVPEGVLRRAAELAAWHSQARGAAKVEVSYTERRYVRKPKGAPLGTVTLLEEKVIVISGGGQP